MKSVTAFHSRQTARGSSIGLTGDAMVPTLQQQLRSTLGDNVTVLKAIGVTIATDGQLTADRTADQRAGEQSGCGFQPLQRRPRLGTAWMPR
jgi:hypothetical protein